METASSSENIKFIVSQLTSGQPLDQRLAQMAAGIITDLARRAAPKEQNIRVDLNRNELYRGASSVRLTPNQASAMYAIVRKYPMICPLDEIKRAIYGKHAVKSLNAPRVIMTHIRKVIRPLELDIVNRHGFGYGLEVDPKEGL